MSDAGDIHDLAGEYVLGVLDDAVRLDVGHRLEHERDLRAAVRAWETRLAPLVDAIPPVEPPGWIWRRLALSTANAAARSGPRSAPPSGRLWSNPTVWRGATAASLALAASLAFVLAMPRADRVVGSETALVAYGERDASFVADRLGNGSLALRPLGTVGVPDGRDLELWASIPGRAAPVALGVLPASGRVLTASDIPGGTARLLVSLEPKGGSPTGLPTGPVLFAGTIHPS